MTTTSLAEPPATSPATSATSAATDADSAATRAFSFSVVASGIRCSLAYVVFPWLLPAAGVAGGIAPEIGIAVGLVAIAFNLASIRRFQRSAHRWRWHVTALNVAVIGLLLVLLAQDVGRIL